MWEEIKRMQKQLPDKGTDTIKHVTILERSGYLDIKDLVPASGKYPLDKNMMRLKKYKGPEIKP